MEPIDQLLIEFEEQERWRDLLGEVLAVLNRDGGHYQTKHGAGRAAIEGVRSHYQMLTTIDALQAENIRLRAQAEAAALLSEARAPDSNPYSWEMLREAWMYRMAGSPGGTRSRTARTWADPGGGQAAAAALRQRDTTTEAR